MSVVPISDPHDNNFLHQCSSEDAEELSAFSLVRHLMTHLSDGSSENRTFVTCTLNISHNSFFKKVGFLYLYILDLFFNFVSTF